MNKFMKLLAVLGLAVLGLFAKPTDASAYSYAKSIIPTSGSTVFVGTAASYTSAEVSNSALGLLTSTGNGTANSYIWDVTPPWSEQVTLRRFIVTYNVAVIAMDATPTFTVVKQAISSSGTGTTRTLSTLANTTTSCGAVVNTTYSCVVTLTTPINVLAGETYYLKGAFDNAATSIVFISNIQIRGSGY